MAKIVVFGASGKAGREIAAVAESRGHEVTRIGRDPGVRAAAEVAAGHDVAVSAVADLSRDATGFYTEAARALVASGAGRIIVVGIYTLMETSPGVRVIDDPDFPDEHKPFCLGHAAGVDVLAESDADWLVMSPAGMFGGAPTGTYRLSAVNPADELSYEDFALAVVDEIDRPAHRRTQIGIASA
ncbi:NAD(P)H-binding protein [Lentzea sp. BCCO 10_0856]|uniref:NAD(P)H-binding protein n=1 Tax=Lentzea miocenica TaxID=3095431 RepID=A0ABU4T4C5_9PSEU|nr:NAD(P)H-binding protein [Lentzea sp. BCCO 10_0856]MDX8033020.1 NAD(P)H-binding protein [Lentzea sp. BCCO 10_0856]